MTGTVTVIFGDDPARRPPGWTLPFLVRIAGPISLEAANGGPVLSVVGGGRWAPRVKPGSAA
ncbi:MAG: hypothetical protein J0H01_10795 [Rhizobiales bacterium]|nr:hypothetical protein [Hyphomicrobiales bacterium]